MIVVDSSVWIAHFRNQLSAPVLALRGLQNPDQVISGDVVLLECMQGARDDKHAAQIEATLRAFVVQTLLDDTLAVEAARHFRNLRAIGITPRKTTDLIIASFCIRHGHHLLHQDRDYDPMVTHLGLQLLPAP